mgnify:CR=1 FL=1
MLISNAGLLKAESFEGRESEMNAKCAVIKDTKTQEECSRYKDYLQSKSDNLDKEISDIKSQIASVKGDVEKVSKLIADNNKKIASYEKEISSIQASIDQTQSSISDLKKQIRKKRIASRNATSRCVRVFWKCRPIPAVIIILIF